MNKVLWTLVIFCSAVSVYWVLTGIGPKAIPVIRPSNFSSPGEIAEYSYRQLAPRLAQYRAFAFGVEDRRDEQTEIFVRFVKLLHDNFKEPIVVVSDTKLDAKLFEGDQVEQLYLDDVPEQKRRQTLNQFLLDGKKLVFHLSTFDTAHFRREAMINIIEQALSLKALSFIMARLAMYPEETTIATHCVPPGKDNMNYNPIACLVRTKSTFMQRNKKIAKTKLVGFVERQGEKDFMIYTWVPK